MSCGHSLESPCPHCGTALPTGARFCVNCGHELEAGATADDGGMSAQEVTSQIQESVSRAAASSGERRTITMLFCDVQGSTAAAEQLDPEAWSALMSAAFDRFIAPVERYHGTVARLLGDAILAYFGAPTAHEDDPERAVLAALEILESSRELAEQIASDHGLEFGVRIGINTGLVVVGDVGSDLYGEYAALGDAANVAARMEQTAKTDTIQIAEPTYRLVAPIFDLEPVGEIEIKGKSLPALAYRVLGRARQRGRLRGIAGLESPLVGRDAERDALETAVGDLVAGRGRIASIMGEAGLGKTRLAAEIRATAEGSDLRWLEGQAFSYDVSMPYGPFVGLIETFFELEDVAQDSRYSHIKARVGDLLGDDAASYSAYLAALVGVEAEGEDADLLGYLDPPVLKERTFEAITAYVSGLANTRPTVLVMEDLHWADPTSIDLVERLLGVTEIAPLMMLLLFRPRRSEPSWTIHEIAGREFAHRYLPVELKPLGGSDSQQLVANLLEVEGLSLVVRDLILDKAEGNPFFVEEVVRSLIDQGIVVREKGSFISTRDIQDLDVPDNLAAVLTTRLDQLEPESKRALQTASVIGREFDVGMLDALSDPVLDIDGLVRDLQRREMIVEAGSAPDRRFAFKHALTRDTAYSALLGSTRRDLHRQVGKLLEESHPDRVSDLAHHFTEAGDETAAVPYLVAAGGHALNAFAASDAETHFRAALEFSANGNDPSLTGQAYEGLGQALAFGGRMEESLATYDEMRVFGERVDSPQIQVSALNKKARTKATMMGDFIGAEEDLHIAKEIGDAAQDSAGLAEFHVVYCVVNTSQGKLETAAEHLAEAAELGEEIESPFHRNFGLTHHANTLLHLARYEEATEAAKIAESQAREDGDRLHLATAVGDIQSLIDLRNGDPVAGLAKAQWGASEKETIGAVIDEGYTRYNGGMIALEMGRYEESLEAMGRLLEIGNTTGYPAAIGGGSAGIATVRRSIFGPDDEQAAELAAVATEMLALPAGQVFAPLSFASLAHQALSDHRPDEAALCIGQARGFESATAPVAEPELLLCAASLALQDRDVASAQKHVASVRDLVDERKAKNVEPRLLLMTAMVAAAEGDHTAALESIERGIEAAARMSTLPDLLKLQRQGTAILRESGRPTDADRMSAAADETIDEIAASFTDTELREAFLRTAKATG